MLSASTSVSVGGVPVNVGSGTPQELRAEAARLRSSAAAMAFGGKDGAARASLLAQADSLEGQATLLESQAVGPIYSIMPALPPVQPIAIGAPPPADMPGAPLPGADRRQALIDRYKNAPEFSGYVEIAGQVFRVNKGELRVDGKLYAVSKDGRAVLDCANLLLVGEVVGGVVQKPSASFIDEMSILGGVV